MLDELQDRVGACLSVLLSDDTTERLAELFERLDDAGEVGALLARSVPSQPRIIHDVMAALVEELAATAEAGVIPILASWPVAVPELDTRAAVVLWCRGYRPEGDGLADASGRLAEMADRRRFEEEVERLTDEQREAYLQLQTEVEAGRAEREALSHLWDTFHPDRFERYLFHLGQAIDDFLTHRGETSSDSSGTLTDPVRAMADRGLRFAEGAERSVATLFPRELDARVSLCLSVLLSDDVSARIDELAESPHKASDALARVLPSQPNIIQDVMAALIDELAATAENRVIPVLESWPVTMPELDTRAAVVLWCRGYRPEGDELAETSDRLGDVADRRRFEDEAENLSDEQREAYFQLQREVEAGRAEREALGELWETFHADRLERYLFHLAQAIDDFLTRADEGSTDSAGSMPDLGEAMTARGLRFDEGAESSATALFSQVLQERVGECLSVLLGEEQTDRVGDLIDRPECADEVSAILAQAVPTQPNIVRDVIEALLEELAATAEGGLIPVLEEWPVGTPDLETRAAVVLWCRGYRPQGEELADASGRLADAADRRRWEEEVERLSEEQRDAYLHLKNEVEHGRAEPSDLGELWETFHPDQEERYLFHLGQAIDDFLTQQDDDF